MWIPQNNTCHIKPQFMLPTVAIVIRTVSIIPRQWGCILVSEINSTSWWERVERRKPSALFPKGIMHVTTIWQQYWAMDSFLNWGTQLASKPCTAKKNRLSLSLIPASCQCDTVLTFYHIVSQKWITVALEKEFVSVQDNLLCWFYSGAEWLILWEEQFSCVYLSPNINVKYTHT